MHEVGLDVFVASAVAHFRSIRSVALRIAKMLAQLCAQRRLYHATRQLRQQPSRPRDLLLPQALQRILQRLF